MFRLLACLLLLIAPARAHAQDASAAGPALWRVADADTVIYLFGTYHALPGGVDWYRGPVVAAFDEADEVVFEALEPDGGFDPGLRDRFLLGEGKSLRARLPADVRVHFDTAMARAKMPLAIADRLKPWVAAFLLGGMDPAARAWRGERGVETILGERAEAAGKRLGEVEGHARQTEILDGMPAKLQLAMLRQAIRPRDADDRAHDLRTVEAWAIGDLATFSAGIQRDYGDEPEVARIILDARNADWAEWIVDRLERPGTILLAVGSAHLAGPGSLQDQLTARGLIADRVR